jgi:hypothetical protein
MKITLLLITACLLNAQDVPKPSRILYASMVAVAASDAADIGTTYGAINRGYHEENPLGLKTVTWMNAAAVAGLLPCEWVFRHNRRASKVFEVVNGLLAGEHIEGAIHNSTLR